LHKPDWAPLVAGATTVVPILGSLLAPVVAKGTRKNMAFISVSIVFMVGLMLMSLTGYDAAYFVAGLILSSVAFGCRHAIYFSMQSDLIEFSEKRTGINGAGIISAMNGFVGKIAMAGSGALASYVLARSAYTPSGQPSDLALKAFSMNYLYLPMILVVLSCCTMIFFRPYKVPREIV
jgi:Na+/melibiose symporter-like transporter